MHLCEFKNGIRSVVVLGIETELFTLIETTAPSYKMMWMKKEKVFTYANINHRYFHLFANPTNLVKLNNTVEQIKSSPAFRSYVQNSLNIGMTLSAYDILALRVAQGTETQLKNGQSLRK